MTIKITTALNRHRKALNGSRILFLGVAYKPNIDDERESPALKIIDEVFKKGGEVMYHDPFISEI
jgi:UDP-N-acetyl-D-glucosamine dehydrogenase